MIYFFKQLYFFLKRFRQRHTRASYFKRLRAIRLRILFIFLSTEHYTFATRRTSQTRRFAAAAAAAAPLVSCNFHSQFAIQRFVGPSPVFYPKNFHSGIEFRRFIVYRVHFFFRFDYPFSFGSADIRLFVFLPVRLTRVSSSKTTFPTPAFRYDAPRSPIAHTTLFNLISIMPHRATLLIAGDYYYERFKRDMT